MNPNVRPHLRKPSPGRLYAEFRRATVCPEGHDLTAPGSKVNASGKLFCVQCRIDAGTVPKVRRARNDGKCMTGRHVLTPGGKRCEQCKRESNAKYRAAYSARLLARKAARRELERAALPKHLIRGLPSAEIMDGARCGPGDARLFDPIRQRGAMDPTGETRAEARARHDLATAMCAACPVRQLCYEDGVRHVREGVYGGVVMSYRFHRALRVGPAACTSVDTHVHSMT